MECPRDAASLIVRRYRGAVDIDECPTCGGIWADRGEIERIAALAPEPGEKLPEPPDVVGLAIEEGKQRTMPAGRCPRCFGEMAQEEYGLASQILVERCVAGCGAWLDAGELEAIERFYDRARAEAHEPQGVEGLMFTLSRIFRA